ncbi:MAG TPA: carbon-phosphorus lyase, partial [Lentisphaeria bacterium]|nr:carbon-phosphorus lyase [Lentisphaeria bacterium]
LAVTALAATHAPGKEAQLFVLERGGKRFFVANDTGVIADSELERLRGVRLDLVAVDCTMGNSAKRVDGHFGMRGVVEFRDRLRALGCLDDASQVYVNHFSHNGLCLHRDLEAFFLPRAIKVAYDGLTVEIQ